MSEDKMREEAEPVGLTALAVPVSDLHMAASLMDEAAALLEEIDRVVLEKMPSCRWPIVDELGGAAGILRDHTVATQARPDAQDAARYRWLRAQPATTWQRIGWNTWRDHPSVFPGRDADIDAAMASDAGERKLEEWRENPLHKIARNSRGD